MSLAGSGLQVTKQSILRLYKDLLRYSGKLQFTDKDYYLGRIRSEFRRNQTLEKSEDIQYYYNVSNYLFLFLHNVNKMFYIHHQKGVSLLTLKRLV